MWLQGNMLYLRNVKQHGNISFLPCSACNTPASLFNGSAQRTAESKNIISSVNQVTYDWPSFHGYKGYFRWFCKKSWRPSRSKKLSSIPYIFFYTEISFNVTILKMIEQNPVLVLRTYPLQIPVYCSSILLADLPSAFGSINKACHCQ